MSYARIIETGNYIYPNELGIEFNGKQLSNEEINLFLASLFYKHNEEFEERLEEGRKLLERNIGENE